MERLSRKRNIVQLMGRVAEAPEPMENSGRLYAFIALLVSWGERTEKIRIELREELALQCRHLRVGSIVLVKATLFTTEGCLRLRAISLLVLPPQETGFPQES